MKKVKEQYTAWAVLQKDGDVDHKDVFFSRSDAARYKRDTFLPEHEGRVVRVKVTIEEL
jgi:hypothetical protein